MRCVTLSGLCLLLPQFSFTNDVDVDGQCEKDDCGQTDDAFSPFDIDESLNELDQADPRLVEAIRQRYLDPPGDGNHVFREKYAFTKYEKDGDNFPMLTGQYGQPPAIDK